MMLRCENICKSYRDGTHVTPVLHHINLQVPAGQMVAIVGSDGAGGVPAAEEGGDGTVQPAYLRWQGHWRQRLGFN